MIARINAEGVQREGAFERRPRTSDQALPLFLPELLYRKGLSLRSYLKDIFPFQLNQIYQGLPKYITSTASEDRVLHRIFQSISVGWKKDYADPDLMLSHYPKFVVPTLGSVIRVRGCPAN